jgi:hypothetical protein
VILVLLDSIRCGDSTSGAPSSLTTGNNDAKAATDAIGAGIFGPEVTK